jgi:hypothetical protein
MQDEFLAKPFSGIGGVAGEVATGSPQPTIVTPPLVIPPWDGSSFVDEEEEAP